MGGPNNNKQVIELYTEDGCDRPFFCFLSTPGSGNVVRVVNTAPVEFPMTASVVPTPSTPTHPQEQCLAVTLSLVVMLDGKCSLRLWMGASRPEDINAEDDEVLGRLSITRCHLI